jgi:hypothetical protein
VHSRFSGSTHWMGSCYLSHDSTNASARDVTSLCRPQLAASCSTCTTLGRQHAKLGGEELSRNSIYPSASPLPNSEHSLFSSHLTIPFPFRPTMLRSGAPRLSLRSIARPGAQSTRPAFFSKPEFVPQWQARLTTLSSARRPQAAQLRPVQAMILRRAYAGKIDTEAEERYRQEKLKPTPETVTTTSSTRAVFSEPGDAQRPEKDIDMMKGVKQDLVCGSETLISA